MPSVRFYFKRLLDNWFYLPELTCGLAEINVRRSLNLCFIRVAQRDDVQLYGVLIPFCFLPCLHQGADVDRLDLVEAQISQELFPEF
jgi:hypothetical protein